MSKEGLAIEFSPLMSKHPKGGAPIGRFTTTLLVADLQATLSRFLSCSILNFSDRILSSVLPAVPNSECKMLMSCSNDGAIKSEERSVPSHISTVSFHVLTFFTAEAFFFRGGNIGSK